MSKVLTEKDFILQNLKEIDNAMILYKADWCGYCVKFKPLFEKLATEYPNIVFGVVDVDEQKELVNNNNNLAYPEYDVKGYPTVVFYKNKRFHLKLNPKNRNEKDLPKILKKIYN